MRIAILAHQALSQIPAGIGNYVRRLVTVMSCLDPSSEFRLVCFRGGTAPDGWPIPPNARLVRLPFSSRFIANAMWHPFGAPRVERWIGDVDLLHVTDVEWVVPTALPLVATIHDLFPEHHPDRYKPMAKWRRKRCLAQIRRQALRIIAISEHTRREVVRHLGVDGTAVSCVHPGPPDWLEPRDSEDEIAHTLKRLGICRPFFLFVGRQDLRKNLDRLLEAFARVRGQIDPAPMLVLAGSHGWRFGQLKRIRRRLRLETSVRFTGYLPPRNIRALLDSATALVYPSLTEGFGFPPLEGMVAGVPVIASNAGSIPEVVGDAALLFEPTDVDRLADLMVRVVKDPGLCRDLVARGRQRLPRFSWKRCAEETLRIYREALALAESPGAGPTPSWAGDCPGRGADLG